VQENLYPSVVAMDFAKIIDLEGKDTYNKPYINKPITQTYVPGTDFSVADYDSVNESLSLNTFEVSPIYIDEVDEVLSNYSIRGDYTSEIVQSLAVRIDAKVFSEYDNFTHDVDNGNIGGTAGTSIAITSSNVRSALSAAATKLDNANVPQAGRMAVLSPTVCSALAISLASQDMPKLSEDAFTRGYVGYYDGFHVYKSSNLTWTGRWTPADNPTDGDTITIKGVTLTFKTTPSAPNDVDIGGTTAVTIDNSVTLLNAPGTTTATGIALSAEDQEKLTGLTATDGTTYLGIEFVGGGEVPVSGSEANDLWSLTTVHNVLGQRGRIHLGLAAVPKIGFNQKPLGIPGSGYLVGSIAYGLKTFTRDKDYLVDLNISGADFT
jgi:hypothetical protein